MRKVLILLILMDIGFVQVLLAQKTDGANAPAASNAIPQRDVSGVWNALPGPQQPKQLGAMVPKDVGMTPWAQARFDAADGGLNATNPQLTCQPPGATRWTQYVRPFEIVQTPGRIYFFPEIDHIYRVVYMDGRPIPKVEDLPFGPTYMGYSVGHWDGNDLIVDTIGVTDKTWLDTIGHPHTDDMHLTERYHRASRGILEVSFTFDDPKAYTKSWTYGPRRYELETGPQWEIQEQECIVSDQNYFQQTVGNHLKDSEDKK